MKTLKEEKPASNEAPKLGSEQELSNKFAIDPTAEVKQEVKDWSINKGGNSKSGLLNVKTANPKLTLCSTEAVKASSIIIGFLAIDNAEKNNIYPASVSCWVGDSVDSLVLLGHVEPVDDQNFSSSLTRVYGLNLNKLKPALPDSKNYFNTYLNRGFKVLEFRMRKPNLASLADIFEGSQKSSENGYYTISFVSVNGYQEPTTSPSFV